MDCTNIYNGINCGIAYNRKRKRDKGYLNPLFWVFMITLPLAQPTIMIQFFIILGFLSQNNPPVNIDLPVIFIFLIFYNITFGLSHPNMIGYRV
jgi:hypothetical protein